MSTAYDCVHHGRDPMRPCICGPAYTDTADMAHRFRRWPGHGGLTCGVRAFDVGVTCQKAISTGVPGKPYDGCGRGRCHRGRVLRLRGKAVTGRCV